MKQIEFVQVPFWRLDFTEFGFKILFSGYMFCVFPIFGRREKKKYFQTRNSYRARDSEESSYEGKSRQRAGEKHLRPSSNKESDLVNIRIEKKGSERKV